MNAFAQFVAQQLEQPAPQLPVAGRRRVKEPVPPGGDLSAAVLKFIQGHPNQDVREIADVLEVKPPQLYGVLQELKKRNLIVGKRQFGNMNTWKAVASC